MRRRHSIYPIGFHISNYAYDFGCRFKESMIGPKYMGPWVRMDIMKVYQLISCENHFMDIKEGCMGYRRGARDFPRIIISNAGWHMAPSTFLPFLFRSEQATD